MQRVACMLLFVATLVLNACATAGSDGPDPDGVVRMFSRQLQLPVMVEASQKQNIKELQLFTSTDGDKTWQQVGRLGPDGERFRFEAPHDGMYWFSLRIVKCQPAPKSSH